MEIIDYKICKYSTVDALEKAVKEALRHGWDLKGGVSMAVVETHGYHSFWYAQAIVKTK